MEAVKTPTELQEIACKVRKTLVELSHRTRTPHLGSSLSCVDILVAIYWNILKIDPLNPDAPDRDRFILSKGHGAPALYSVLAHRGFFPRELVFTCNQDGSHLAEHPTLKSVPGIEAATGSLGHGLSLGLGMALAGRIQRNKYRIFAVMSDGECNEGSVWEAAMFASAHNLNNVTVVIDYNKWQATGRSNEVLALKPLKEKWESFGWSSYEIDGHNMNALLDVLNSLPDGSNKPVAIIANTVKGKGISFMEDDNNWHYRIPNAEELKMALEELK